MHEMGIAIQILNIVNQSMPPDEDLKVKSIHLRVGKLTAIVPQSLKFCMEVVTKDTRAQGAELVFTEVPVQAECKECGEVSVIESMNTSIPPMAISSSAVDIAQYQNFVRGKTIACS